MTKIEKKQCPSCGGELTVDNEKQLYRCTSCGSTYDYDFFREEKLNEMGETHLSRREFGAAVDAFRLLLKKNPHDFQALRGLMLAAAYLKDIDGLVRLGEAKHFSFDSQMVREVLDSASEEDTGYFEDLARIYYCLKKLSDCNAEIKSLRREKDRIEQTIVLEEQDTYNYKISSGYYSGKDPVTVFITLWMVALGLLIIMLCVVVPLAAGGEGFTALIVGLVFVFFIGLTAVVNMTEIYPEVKEEKDLKEYVRELRIESEAFGPKIRKLETEAEELSAVIKTSINDFVKKDTGFAKKESRIKPESVKEQVSETGKIRKHQCPSCGGRLRIDSDKQMYHCAFCGSAYDYEYFREDRIHEAGETYLSRGEFMATSDAYEFMLKKDPHDFIALRGLMLTAAHLTSMDELDKDNDKEGFLYDTGTVSQVIESASEEDKEYFMEFARVYSEKKKLVDKTEEIKALWKEKDKINTMIAQNNASRKDYFVNGDDGSKHSPKTQFIIMWCITGYCMLWTIGFGIGLVESLISDPDSVNTSFILFIPAFLASAGLIGFNYIFNYSKIRKLKKFDKDNAELYVESGKMDEKIRDLENESDELLKGIRRSIHDFVRKDRLRMIEKDA